MSSEPVSLDHVDRALVDRLRVDGREGNRSLAQALGVNEVTVAARLRRMEEAAIMRVVAITDMRLFGHREFAFALIRVSGRSVVEVATELASLPEAIVVTICTGRYDVIVPILGRDRRHLAELFGTVLPQINGVDQVSGCIALDVLKFEAKWAALQADPGSLPEAEPSETVDEMDLDIIRELQVDARRSNRSIAKELGVSEGTVRSRIKRMLADRVFKIQAVCDIGAFGIGAYAFLAISSEGGRADDVAKALVDRGDVAQLSRVLGDFDLLALLIAPTREELIRAILDEISVLPGVRRTETFDTYGSTKHTYAWTWIV